MPDYNFISLGYRERVPSGLTRTFVLKSDDWNDYGNRIRFDLIYFDGAGVKSEIGKVKILHRMSSDTGHVVEGDTKLPVSFPELTDSYISLGQSEDYYKQLSILFGAVEAVEILETLRDIAEMPGIAADFETSPPFRNGMMRENSAKRARRFGRSWVRGNPVSLKVKFTYTCQLGQGGAPTTGSFDFSPRDVLPGRIVAIVGRNAVGKTVFLSELATDLAQVDRISEERLTRKLERFPEEQPLFARVIAISYSAFDRFRRPQSTPHSSYIYCGIRDERGAISASALNKSYNQNRKRIREHGRELKWVRYISKILGDAEGLNQTRLNAEITEVDGAGFLDGLSSGQAILCHFVTGLLAWIEHESIALFDEPETHLHPNAVGNLFLVLSEILEDYDSYAVVATHSPVVLQEVPSKRVLHFVRDGDTTTAELLAVESFGESVTELTRHVFKTFEVESLYKKVLTELADRMPAEQVLSLFPNGLSIAAQSYLLGQYGAKLDR